MPIFDSRIGLSVADGKPDRICENCLTTRLHGMKACARCNSVRYCTKDCQRQHWPEHRLVCCPSQFLDLGGYITAYRWLFKWAAMEALEVHTNPTSVVYDCLWVTVVRADHVETGPIQTPFFIQSATVVNYTKLLNTIMPDGSKDANRDIEASLAIREAGGMGQALLAFTCHTNGYEGPRLVSFDRIPLHDKPLGINSGCGLPQWEAVLKGIANDEIALSDIASVVGLTASNFPSSSADLFSTEWQSTRMIELSKGMALGITETSVPENSYRDLIFDEEVRALRRLRMEAYWNA